MTTVSTIEIASGQISQESRAELRDQFASLPDGWHKVITQQVKRGYTSTRYKYYFGHVLETILLTAGGHFQVIDETGVRAARSTDEIHQVLKLKFNPVMVLTPNGAYMIPQSTTELPDGEFIQKYEEAIIIEFSAEPYFCDFMSREEYAAMMKEKSKILTHEKRNHN